MSYMTLSDVREALRRVLEVIKADKSVFDDYYESLFSRKVTVETIENLAGNHLFDNHPERFDITEQEGQRIRSYFQVGINDYDFVSELHKEFPDIFEPESKKYLDRINENRKGKGLEPISI